MTEHDSRQRLSQDELLDENDPQVQAAARLLFAVDDDDVASNAEQLAEIRDLQEFLTDVQLAIAAPQRSVSRLRRPLTRLRLPVAQVLLAAAVVIATWLAFAPPVPHSGRLPTQAGGAGGTDHASVANAVWDDWQRFEGDLQRLQQRLAVLAPAAPVVENSMRPQMFLSSSVDSMRARMQARSQRLSHYFSHSLSHHDFP